VGDDVHPLPQGVPVGHASTLVSRLLHDRRGGDDEYPRVDAARWRQRHLGDTGRGPRCSGCCSAASCG
jgi:hypothetical protein